MVSLCDARRPSLGENVVVWFQTLNSYFLRNDLAQICLEDQLISFLLRLQGPTAIAVSPNGAKLYVACKHSFRIVLFDINQNNGWLRYEQGAFDWLSPSRTDLDIVSLLAHSRFVYAASPFPGSVHVFEANDYELKEISRVSKSQVSSTLCF
jgi:6-phosphogluconolactonase (cycloisomerase 2 family)